jgi:hypothetical protein
MVDGGAEDENFVTPGSGGDGPEREWASNVCESIRTKAGKLASGLWTPAGPYDLVLDENGPTNVGVDLPKALSNLRALLNAQRRSGFRTFSIIADSFSRLVYLEGDSHTLPIPPIDRVNFAGAFVRD